MSGGQQQRVALARALAISPRVLLLDEPLSALDAKVREQLRDEIRRIQLELGVTTVFVTHDQEEALSMADRVGVMRAGQLEQCAAPAELYDRPATPFVAEFVGTMNRLDATVAEGSHGPGRQARCCRPTARCLRPGPRSPSWSGPRPSWSRPTRAATRSSRSRRSAAPRPGCPASGRRSRPPGRRTLAPGGRARGGHACRDQPAGPARPARLRLSPAEIAPRVLFATHDDPPTDAAPRRARSRRLPVPGIRSGRAAHRPDRPRRGAGRSPGAPAGPGAICPTCTSVTTSRRHGSSSSIGGPTRTLRCAICWPRSGPTALRSC